MTVVHQLYESQLIHAEDVGVGDLIQDLRSYSHVDSVTRRQSGLEGGMGGERILIVHRYQQSYRPLDVVVVLRPVASS